MSADYTRLHRLMALMQFIAGKRGVTTRELVHEFGIDERTVRRDIEILRETGIPCSHDPEAGGYVIRKGFFLPPVEFTFDEALSLLLLMELLPAEEKIPYQTTARRALQKLRSQFREEIKEDLDALEGNIQIDVARGSGDDGAKDVYQKVRQAIRARRVLRCTYDSNRVGAEGKEEEIFELRPYTLWYAQRAWYVVGYHCGRGEVRQLKLNRFTYMEVTGKPYGIPDDFSMKSYLGNAWRMIGGAEHRVRVHFDKGHATTVSETRWHPTQSEEAWDEEGGVTLTFQVAGLDEIKYWILSYGPAAQVLDPLELASEIKNLAQATARRYETSR